MRILLLNEYFPPDTSATAKMAAAVVSALAERHQVTVLCGRPSYDPAERHPYYLWRRDRRGKYNVVRVGSTTHARVRMLHRVINYLSYVILAVPAAMLVRADVVLAMTDPPFQGIVGAFVALLKRRPLIYNIRDLYPEMALEGRIVQPAFWVRIWERLHCWALRRAAKIVVLGEDTRERIISKGIDPARVAVVRDGVLMPQAEGTREHAVVQEIRRGFRFVVLHAGNLGFYGAWDTLLKAAEMLDGDGIGFVFVGDGAQRERIAVSAKGCPAVKLLPFQPAEEVRHVLAAADLHMVTVRRGLEGVVVPSKLYPILAAGGPVLALASRESDVARVVAHWGCGVVVDPDSPASLAAAVQDLARNPTRVAEMSRRARELAPSFSMQKELQLFTQIVEAAWTGRRNTKHVAKDAGLGDRGSVVHRLPLG